MEKFQEDIKMMQVTISWKETDILMWTWIHHRKETYSTFYRYISIFQNFLLYGTYGTMER